MIKAGLIGTPIEHSLSPALFDAAYNKRWAYNLLEYNTIEDGIKEMLHSNYKGCNITTPFKESALKFATHNDPLSSRIAATNLLVQNNNEITSYNTDYFGVLNTISKYTTKELNILVLGYGGAGRAATAASLDLCCKTTVAVRNTSKAQLFPQLSSIKNSQNKAQIVSLDHISSIWDDAQLVINTLPSDIPIFKNLNINNKIIFEASYKNGGSLTEQQKQLCTYISGKEWLLRQAIPAFEIITATHPNIKAMQLIVDNL